MIIKKNWHWLLLLFLFITPILLYKTLSLPCGFNAIGGDSAPKEWLSFWATYINAIITSIMIITTVYVIRKQIHMHKHQQEINWLNNISGKLNELYDSYNIIELNLIADRCYEYDRNKDDDTEQLINKVMW